MLFEFPNGLVDVIRERPYDGIVTLRAATRTPISYFEDVTPTKPLRVPHHLFPWILHLNADVLSAEVSPEILQTIEVVDRITPEPAAFVIDWAFRNEIGEIVQGYDVCWPQDIDVARNNVAYDFDNLIDEVRFLPLFEIPKKLLGLQEDEDEGF